MDLRSLIGHVEAIAPSSRAESWDNVGLLVEPSGNPNISCALLTTDLTEQVLVEAQGLGAGLVISYHPPIFHALKRLTQRSAKERIVVQALECGIAVYSPHTALDCMEGGVNDWLLAGLGQGKVQALALHTHTSSPDKLLLVHDVEEGESNSLGLPEAATVKSSCRCVDHQTLTITVVTSVGHFVCFCGNDYSRCTGKTFFCSPSTVTQNYVTLSGHAQRKMSLLFYSTCTVVSHPAISPFTQGQR